MLSLILRILVVVGLLAAAILAGAAFMAVEGQATVSFAGYEIAMRTSSLLVVLALLLIVGWLAIAIMRHGVMWLFSFAGWAEARRRRNGLDALAKTLIALAEGDGPRASREAERAERLLRNPDLTRLINAQAARLAGDDDRAERYFEEMAEDRDTDYLGMMGLLRAAKRAGQTEQALRLAEQAHALRPKKAEVLEILFDLQKARGDFDGARQSVQALVKAGRLTRDVGDRRRAVLCVADALAREARGDVSGALEQAMGALRLAPGFAPAAVAAGRLLHGRGEKRGAGRRFADAWRVEPHPDLSEAFAKLEPGETPEERLKRFERLFAANPGHPETKLLKAELALASGDADLAARAIGDAVETLPVARAYALRAAIEEAQGADEAVVRGWLAKAATAPRAPRWSCKNCGAATTVWSADCPNCGAFDQLAAPKPRREDGDERVDILSLISTRKALAAPKADPSPPAAVEPNEVTPPSRDGGGGAAANSGAGRIVDARVES